MPRRKRAPQRRGQAAVQPTAAKRSRRSQQVVDEEDAVEVAARTSELMKELGLDEERWQPFTSAGPSFRVPVHVTKQAPATTELPSVSHWHLLGQVKLYADVAGISNVLTDHVHTSRVEIQLLFDFPKHMYFIIVNAFTPSSPRPLVFRSEVTLNIPEHADSVLVFRFRAAGVQLHLSLPFTDPSQLPLMVMVGGKLMETEGADAFYSNRGAWNVTELLHLFYPEEGLHLELQQPVPINQRSSESCQ